MFDDVPDAVRPILEAIHGAVKSVLPKDMEDVACGHARPKSKSMMWKLVRYERAGKALATVGTFSKHSAIFFANGAELPDPDGLLEGGGKLLRYVTLRTAADAKRAGVKRLLKAAFAAPRAPR